MNLKLIVIGEIQNKAIKALCDDFEIRLSHYVTFDVEVVAPEKAGKLAMEGLAKKEGEKVLSKIRPDGILIILDELGKEMSSVQFSTWMQQKMNSGIKTLYFHIGGAYGISAEVRKRANLVLGISQMTFTHEMARLFFTEQVYRSMTILRNEKYHH